MKLDDLIEQYYNLRGDLATQIKELRQKEAEYNAEYNKKVETLAAKAKKDEIFKIRLGDYLDRLAEELCISRDQLDVAVDMRLVVMGDAKRINTLKLFDNNVRNREYKKLAVSIRSNNPAVKYSETIVMPYRLTYHNLADGSKFRDNLIYEKFKDGKQTYTTLTFDQMSTENLIVDFGYDLKSRSGTGMDVLFDCVRKKEAGLITIKCVKDKEDEPGEE